MPVHLDAQVVALTLPIELALCLSYDATPNRATHLGHVEEILGRQYVFARQRHQDDSCRLILRLGNPVNNHVLLALACLSRFPIFITHGRPFEILHSLNFDTLLFQKRHCGSLKHRNTLSHITFGDVRVVGRPLEDWPLHRTRRAIFIRVGVGGEGLQEPNGSEIPNDDLRAFVIRTPGRIGKCARVGERFVGPCDEVFLAWGELDESDTGMSEAKDVDPDGSIQSRSRPQRDADAV